MAGTEAANAASATTAANGATAGASAANGSNSNNTSSSNSTEVWSGLLKSVASSRLVSAKDVIILGDPHSGKSTLIELLKTALPTPSSDALANGADGSNNVNGALPAGQNGVSNTGNGSAPVMVEMGTSTGEDHLFADGQKKNDLALSYSYWDVEDDENEDTVARLGLYQIAGSNKSYYALLKYCFNTKTIANSAVMIVLDWSKPWTFMETLLRWVKVLDTAIKQICQEGAVATATWTKGKAMVEELQEKLSRFLQEYTEPQANPAAGTSAFSESQTFSLGSTDAQSVLLPLTEGCLTNNTGVPIVIVCTKSDYINSLEREMDYKEETFDYIQQSLRTICLKYGASLFYTSIHHPHTYANLRQYLLHRLLTPSTLNSAQQQQQQQQQQPSTFPFRLRAQVVERDQVMVPAGWDSIGKIKVLRNGFDCEGVADGWESDMKAQADGAQQANGTTAPAAGSDAGARQVYEEVIVNPKRSNAPATIQPLITAEDDQVFLDKLQRTGSELPSGVGSGGLNGSANGPPVVGPLSSGYTSMLNSHHASPPPAMSSGGQSIGYDSDDVEGRLKRLTSQKSKVNGGGGSSSGLLGPSLSEAGVGAGAGGMSAASMKYLKSMNENGRQMPPMAGAGNSGAASSLMGGLGGTNGLQRTGSAGGGAGTLGGASAASGQAESAAISHFFQSLMTRKGSGLAAGGGGLGGLGGAGAAAAGGSPSAAGSGSNDA
ncbi:hypothetical protein BGZ58_006228 [Dissophora ornata]|nr:hypothetical protein BGZ58_006228 [Dissophora ornata]